jgi:hypothetical protein
MLLAAGVIKVLITKGRMRTARDQLAMISELWSLCGIKGKIAARRPGRSGINR